MDPKEEVPELASESSAHQPKKNRHRPHHKKKKTNDNASQDKETLVEDAIITGIKPEEAESSSPSKAADSSPKSKPNKLKIVKLPEKGQTPKLKGQENGAKPKAKSQENGAKTNKKNQANGTKSKSGLENVGKNEAKGKKPQEAAKNVLKENLNNFPEYYQPHVVAHALKKGVLFSGCIRINPRSYKEAYVTGPDNAGDVCIIGIRDRNRALHGDIVAVDILHSSKWRVNVSKLRDHQLNISSSLADKLEDLTLEASNDETKGNPEKLQDQPSDSPKKAKGKTRRGKRGSPQKKLPSISDDMSIKELMKLFPETWETFAQKTGRVVAILEKQHSRCSVGYLKMFPDNNPNYALFAANDGRFPRLKIPKKDCPQDFFVRPQDFEKFLFIGEITAWNQVNFGLGKLTHNLGSDESIEARSRGILITNGFDYEPQFSQEIENQLPNLPFVIPQEEISKRRDFRKNCVFTVDPLTARDLDDALSVEPMDDGNFKVGVHIADVSYFVAENTLLNSEAEHRATSVYLVQNVLPMLPRTLCEHLCSLNPGEDRLTFSVEWVLSPQAEILSTWFGRSVIRSAVKLAYEHAQEMIDLPDKQWTVDELPVIEEPWDAQIISEKVNLLQKLAVQLRSKREQNGALRLDQPKLCFSLNKETGMPQGFKIHEHQASNKLIEEFMLLANISVATKIQESFPKLALLRCHPSPKLYVLDQVLTSLKSFGIDIDPSTSGTIQQSLNRYRPQDPSDQNAAAKWHVLMSALSKPMQNAEYFCVGLEEDFFKYRHYALSVPLYTHFTSPIRRYPDIIVHRLLDAALREQNLDSIWNPEYVGKKAAHCNGRKLSAKAVSEKSAETFLSLFIHQCGPIVVEAAVMNVMDFAMDCILSGMNVIRRVYVNRNEEIEKFEYAKKQGKFTLTVHWKDDKTEQDCHLFSIVKVSLEADPKNSFEFNARLVKPSC